MCLLFLIGCIGNKPKEKKIFCKKPEYSDVLQLSFGNPSYFDFHEGLECSKSVKKLNLIYFTGHGCVECVEMESVIFTDLNILNLINDKFILTSLFVDDKTAKLKKGLIDSLKTKNLFFENLGNYNSYLMNTTFKENKLPAFYILDTCGNIVGTPFYYSLSVDSFKLFLFNGINTP
jgi:thiol:disulfide interchange protein DsbD